MQDSTHRTPSPSRYAALSGAFFDVDYHERHPDNYQLVGAVGGEYEWEQVDRTNEAHIALRRKAMALLPEMVRELEAAHSLLAAADDEHAFGTSSAIGETLSELDAEAVSLGLDRFAVLREGPGFAAIIEDSHRESYDAAREIAEDNDRRLIGGGVRHYVVPAGDGSHSPGRDG